MNPPPPNGTVFVLNADIAPGGRINAVQGGDQYNYIYRSAPPYRVEPFPVTGVDVPPPGLAWVPSRLLTARHQVVPFFARPELAVLRAWRDAPAPGLSVRLLYGEGGRGKTRLAAEFAASSADDGWTVAQARHRSEAASASGDDESLTVRRPGMVMIVDYAERWPMADLVTLVRQHREAARDRLRMLLLARPAGAWWQGLAYQLAKLDVFDIQALPLTPLPDDSGTRGDVYTSARDSFATALSLPGHRTPDVPGDLDHEQFALPLAVHMRALVDVDAARRGTSPPAGRDLAALSSYLLDREHDHWRSSHDGGRGPGRTNENVMRRAVYLAALTRPLPPAEAAIALTRTAAVDADTAGQVLWDHAHCYPPQEIDLVFEALTPDRLAEDFLALTLPGHEERFGYHATDPWAAPAAAMLLEHPADAEPPALTGRVLTVMIETAHRWPHLVNAHLLPLLLHRPALAPAAGSAALSRLCDLEDLPSVVFELIQACLPPAAHVTLDVGAAAVTRRVVHDRMARGVPDAEAGSLLTHLAWRCSQAGQLAESVEHGNRAVEIYRRLADADPAHLPDLASACNILGANLIGQSRYAEAEAPLRESVDMFRRLAEQDGARYSHEYAMTLNNLSVQLLRSGKIAEAVAPAAETLRVMEQQADDDPAERLPELATALLNLANAQSENGSSQEGLDTVTACLRIYQRLARTDRPAHLPRMAAARINHGLRLSQAGQFEEAATATRQAIDECRELVKANPDAHLPVLAMAWDNLGNILACCDRPAEALRATRNGLAIRQQLCDEDPAYDRSGLAKSLANLSIRLSQQDEDPESGLDSARRAVSLFVQLCKANPVHQADLLTALRSLAHWYSRSDNPRGAIAATEFEYKVRLRTAKQDPATHDAALAGVAHTLGVRYTELGNRQRALTYLKHATLARLSLTRTGTVADAVALTETVELISRHLVEDGDTQTAVAVTVRALDTLRHVAEATHLQPAYAPQLATLSVLAGIRLSQAGATEQSLSTTRTAVDLFEGLDEQDPGAHLPSYAVALKIFALARVVARTELSEALRASTEAVRLYRLLSDNAPPGTASADLPDCLSAHAEVQAALGLTSQADDTRRERDNLLNGR